MIGRIIGNYKIEQKIGEGGMGAVYRGVDTMLDREVAIKALRPELTSQESVVERFRAEAVTLAKLNHPNIATLYTMFRQGEELYMVQEFVRGETLDTILQRRGALAAEEAIPVFTQVLDGIDHAHELGIVHRDIKPANMMLTEKGTLKVLDFGIARLLGSARMTRAGNIIGTLEYMAPEQVRGQETDARSDIYSLGMMLYEILTGVLPFQTENEFELMKMQTEQMPQRPRDINPAISVEVQEAILTAIAKNPDERFQTAGEFRETLLAAGYASSGAMRSTTGAHAALQSLPGVSKPGVAAASTPEKAPIKETKLGASIAPPSNAGAKETRLGASVAASPSGLAAKATRLGASVAPGVPVEAAGAAAPASFMSKLTPLHYAGAGVAVLLLLSVVIAVPVMMLGGKAETPSPEAAETKTAKPEERPQIVEMPKQEQPALSSPPAVSSDTQNAPPAASKPLDLTPIPETASKAAPKPAEKPAVVAQKPAAPVKAAPAKKPAAKKPSLDDVLEGN